ncbi:MAG: FAD-dependent oxidoreductase [Clostridia bacterium]|nr:FAD-dependent oxidoreductase [Clostridia bacterium]
MLERKEIRCDLCVIGGGIAGICAAVSAAREGSTVVLMHERPVLGGNASSEIRMWICGARGKDNKETGILEEIFLENAYRNPTKNFAIWDTVLYEIVKRERNITLLLNCTCMDAVTEEGDFADGRTVRIKSVCGYQMTTQKFFDVTADFFADCSGDSILAPLTGASFRIGRESKQEFGENIRLEESDSMTMGMSCLIQGRETHGEVEYTPPAFATPLTAENFIGRDPDLYKETENFWYLELGGDRDSVGDTEEIRDELVSLAAGTWDYVKNKSDGKAANWDLDFLGFLPGKRESRRMMGEYIVTERDISANRVFEDEVAYGGWPLDDHLPGGFFIKGAYWSSLEVDPPYSIPYRALYSKNVENLFFAGRNISMTHTAMSSMRVMATCGLLGEAVGRAATLCVKYRLAPHGVYKERLTELQESLLKGDCFLPSKKRKIGAACLASELNAPDLLRNGEDRAHRIYGTTDESAQYIAKEGEEIIYRFDKGRVNEVHIVFSSDLANRPLATRANVRLDAPLHHLPTTLVKDFAVYGELEGKRKELLSVENNRKRCHHINVGEEFDSLILVPKKGRSDDRSIPVISFDFV